MATTPVIVSGSAPQAPAGGQPAPTGAAAPGQPGGGETTNAADVAALRSELDALKGKVTETERTAQYWFEKAKAGDKPAKGKEPEGEPETDVLDLITSKGEKGLAALLKKQGFASKEEVASAINSAVAQKEKEAELLREYPDLGKKDSDFFKATALEYGTLKQSGVPESVAMEMATKSVALRFLQEGKTKTPAQQTADAKAEREAARLARIAAQSGDRGGRAAGDEGDGEDETLDADEQMAVRRLADALDITLDKAEARYRARAKAGVQVSFKAGRR